MSLLDLYNSWTFKTPTVVNTQNTQKTPRDAATVNSSSPGVGVDFLPDTYQAEIRNRGYRDTTIQLDTDPTKTKGTFNTTTAFGLYSTFLSKTATRNYYNNSLTTAGTKTIHLYNAQGTNVNDKYITSTVIKNTPGALYNTNS